VDTAKENLQLHEAPLLGTRTVKEFDSILRCRPASAQPPLVLKELDYGLLKCWLVRRGAVVAFTFALARGWDCLEKPGDLQVSNICFPIEYKDWYVDLLEGFSRQTIHERTTNDGRHHLRIGSRNPSPYEVRRGEVSGNHFPLFEDFCALL